MHRKARFTQPAIKALLLADKLGNRVAIGLQDAARAIVAVAAQMREIVEARQPQTRNDPRQKEANDTPTDAPTKHHEDIAPTLREQEAREEKTEVGLLM